MNTHNYREKIFLKWQSLRNECLKQDYIVAKIEEYTSKLKTLDVNKNFEKWPLDSPFYVDTASFENEVLLVKNYVQYRLIYLDSVLYEFSIQ